MFDEIAKLPNKPYEYFTPLFYSIYGGESEVMAQAAAINHMHEDYFYAFGVEHFYQLPRAVQDYLREMSVIRVIPGEQDD